MFQALANAALQNAAAGALDDEAEVHPAPLPHAEHAKPWLYLWFCSQDCVHVRMTRAASGRVEIGDCLQGEAEDDAGAGAMAGREEWFARAAAVGRAAAGQSAAFLAQCIAEKQQSLQQGATTGAHYLPAFCSGSTCMPMQALRPLILGASPAQGIT